MTMISRLCEKLSGIKNLLFLIMCLFVHAMNVCIFYCMGIMPLVYLNLFSTFFYILILLLFKEDHDILIVFTYFEILIFSLISDLFTRGAFLYLFYVLGMIAVVFYLLPAGKKNKHLYQVFGVVIALFIYSLRFTDWWIFPQYKDLILANRSFVGTLNLAITLFTLFYVSNLYLVDLNLTRAKLDYSSNHDMLTGLYNRRFFENIMKRNKTEIENKFSIAMFDVDNFKKINDTYGHTAGDMILEKLSKTFDSHIEKDSIVVRWGGEEFILYMPQTDNDKAYLILDDILRDIRAQETEYEGKTIKYTVTVGLCTGNDLTDYERIIKEADARLYYGKKHGKNCIISAELRAEKTKEIVVYFSHAGENYGVGVVEKGSTQLLAEYIAQLKWCEIFRIEEEKPYPQDFEACQEVSKKEHINNSRPALKGKLPDLSDVGTIYLGFPNWWGDMPMCVYTFLESYDLQDVTIYPFCTHEGNGFDRAEMNLRSSFAKARVHQGFETRGRAVFENTAKVKKLLTRWLVK